MSLKKKLTLVIVAVLAILSAFQITLETRSQQHSAIQALKTSSQRVGNTTAIQLSDWLASKVRILKVMTTMPQDEHFTDYLWQAQRSGGVNQTYFGRVDGAMITGDPSYRKPQGYDPRQRPWYQDAQNGELYISTPYKSADTGNLVLTLAQKIDNGVMAIDMSIQAMVEQLQSLNDASMYAFLVNNKGQILVYPEENMVNKQLTELSPDLSARNITSGKLSEVTINGKQQLVRFSPIKGSPWALGLSYSKDRAFADASAARLHSIIYGVISFIIIAIIFYGFIHRAFIPLNRLNRQIDDLAEGTADLTVRLANDNNDEIGQISRSFDRVMERLHQMLITIRDNTQQLVAAADTSAQYAQQSTQELDHQQQEVTQVATALHEMSATANDVASHAEQTASAAQSSQENSQNGQQLMRDNQAQISGLADQLEQTAQGVQQLDADSQSIAKILLTIQDIAEQTNLLALNAAIEAARAGEQGRGFSVVADEVRNLSQRTHSSTEEIQKMLEQLAQNTQQTVSAMQQSREQAQQSVEQAEMTNTALMEIAKSITEISDMSTQIASAAEEQRAVTEEISRNTQGISDASTNLQQQANESAEHAQKLHNIAAGLQQQIGQFEL